MKNYMTKTDGILPVIVYEELVLVAVVLVTTDIAVDDGTFLLLFDFGATLNSKTSYHQSLMYRTGLYRQETSVKQKTTKN